MSLKFKPHDMINYQFTTSKTYEKFEFELLLINISLFFIKQKFFNLFYMFNNFSHVMINFLKNF